MEEGGYGVHSIFCWEGLRFTQWKQKYKKAVENKIKRMKRNSLMECTTEEKDSIMKWQRRYTEKISLQEIINESYGNITVSDTWIEYKRFRDAPKVLTVFVSTTIDVEMCCKVKKSYESKVIYAPVAYSIKNLDEKVKLYRPPEDFNGGSVKNRSNWEVLHEYELCGMILRDINDDTNEGHFTCLVKTENCYEKNDKGEKMKIGWRTYDDTLPVKDWEEGVKPVDRDRIIVAVCMREVPRTTVVASL